MIFHDDGFSGVVQMLLAALFDLFSVMLAIVVALNINQFHFYLQFRPRSL